MQGLDTCFLCQHIRKTATGNRTECVCSEPRGNLGSSQARRHLQTALPDVRSVLFPGREVSVSALCSPSQDLPCIGLP